MTTSEDAREVLKSLDVTREEAVLAAKSVAQQIIQESKGSDEPLSCMVYDVWGLYNEGSPKCRWTAPYESDDLVFSGQFRVKDTDSFVVRRKVLEADAVQQLVREMRGSGVDL
jgi:hypothetical protein